MRTIVVFSLLAACNCHPQPAAQTAPAPTPEPPPAPDYEVHEWGLINVSDQGAELAAGPGNQQDVIQDLGLQGYGKPVLYFHLADDSPDFDLRVDVRLRSFALAEHFPAAEIEGDRLRWEGRAQACTPQPPRSYPSPESELCQRAVDGYCEASELGEYETTDASCVAIGDTEWPLLFYRGAPADEPPPLPLLLGFDDEGAYAQRSDDQSETIGKVWYMVDQQVMAMVDWPAPGERVRLTGRPPASARRSMHQELIGHGLSEDEGAAFGRAWYELLFGPEELSEAESTFGDIGLRGTGRGGGGVGEGTIGLGNTGHGSGYGRGGLIAGGEHIPTHHLIYWLPEAAHASMAELSFDPAPSAVRRATLVRDQRRDASH